MERKGKVMRRKFVRFDDERNVTIHEEHDAFDGTVWREARDGSVWIRYALLREFRGEKEKKKKEDDSD